MSNLRGRLAAVERSRRQPEAAAHPIAVEAVDLDAEGDSPTLARGLAGRRCVDYRTLIEPLRPLAGDDGAELRLADCPLTSDPETQP